MQETQQGSCWQRLHDVTERMLTAEDRYFKSELWNHDLSPDLPLRDEALALREDARGQNRANQLTELHEVAQECLEVGKHHGSALFNAIEVVEFEFDHLARWECSKEEWERCLNVGWFNQEHQSLAGEIEDRYESVIEDKARPAVSSSAIRFAASEHGRAKSANTEPNMPPDDGPVPPTGFSWKGERREGMTAMSWGLINILWPRKNRSASDDDFVPTVWDDTIAVNKDSLGSARREANNFFRKNSFPWTVVTRKHPTAPGRRLVTLTNEEPRPNKIKKPSRLNAKSKPQRRPRKAR